MSDNLAKRKSMKRKSKSNLEVEQSVFFQFLSSFLHKAGVSNRVLSYLDMRASSTHGSSGKGSAAKDGSNVGSNMASNKASSVVPVDTDEAVEGHV
jgi:hypothetical protein